MKRRISRRWDQRLRALRGEPVVIETDLAPYRAVVDEARRHEPRLRGAGDDELRRAAGELRRRSDGGEPPDRLRPEALALAGEVAAREVGLRPFDEQVMAAVALHRGELAQMETGEGKTLAAALAATLEGVTGRRVHLLTFNDYLARRDAAWMGPIYRFFGLTVGAVQAGRSTAERRAAYGADVTYATAKEAGFDFLRMQLVREPADQTQRELDVAIIDEADSILIDEARVPLVVAGQRPSSRADPSRIAEVVRGLTEGEDYEIDEGGRNVFLTEAGLDRVEGELGCADLHDEASYLLLTEVNQALHARALLRRDVDYIVRDGVIELVDELTGRVVPDRRWPDGLQAALEAKEGLPLRPGGRILGSITLQGFLAHYDKLAGMTATAEPAAEELFGFYGLKVIVIPPHRPRRRRDLPDLIFTHREARDRAVVDEIGRLTRLGRPVLVGTASVGESERLAAALGEAGISSEVLNARHDEREAQIVAEAGALGAVTISTNMAGRGTDIRLGGGDERDREAMAALGGLCVIGTNRHESRRIDDQLRGRAGRQGDPGESRFFVSLTDDLMVRYGIDALIPPRWRPPRQVGPVDNPVIRRQIERLQRIVEGQGAEVRRELWRYSRRVEEQRRLLQGRRREVLLGREPPDLCAGAAPERWAELTERLGGEGVRELAREITLAELDRGWEEHLAFVAQLREGIHLVRLGGGEPLDEFHRRIGRAFWELGERIDDRIVESFEGAEVTADGRPRAGRDLQAPSATWTYLVSDRSLADLAFMISGPGSYGATAGAFLTTWPLLAAWALWRRLRR